MPFAISLKATGPSATRLRELWEVFERFETEPSMRPLGYPPHVTLAIYEMVEERRMRDALAAIAGASVTLTFMEIRFFGTPRFVPWAAPSRSEALYEMHAAIHRRIDEALCHEHYRPSVWEPHVTLATYVSPEREKDARAEAAQGIDEFEVEFDVADCIEFSPIRIIDEVRLL